MSIWPCRLLGLFCSIFLLVQTAHSPRRASGIDSLNQNSSGPGIADRQSHDTQRYTYRKNHDPNGIGKFYMGREIAHVMGFHGAEWLERADREQEEKLSLLLGSLKLEPGMVVADIGAGTGVLSLPIAEKVAPTGKVFAVDIEKKMLDFLAKKLRQRKIRNVELIRGTRKSPQLKADSVDLAIMVDVYHEFDFPYEMTLEISRAIKPGGRVALVEYRKEDPFVPIKLVHKMTESQVRKEIGLPEFALKWKETLDVLPRQHIVVFERIRQVSGDDE